MLEGLKSFVGFFELRFLPEERLRPSLYVRVLMALGGALCLVFGVLTSFSKGLAFHWLLWWHDWSRVSFDFYPLELQHYPHTYSLLLTALGGALCVIASFRCSGRSVALLGLWGVILGLIGSSLSLWEFTMKCERLIPLIGWSGGGYILGSGYSIIFLGILLVLSYPISIGVVHPALSIPLVIPAFLNLLAYPQLPTLILRVQLAYTYILFIVLPVLVVLIPVNIAMVKAFRFMKPLELRTEKETINKVRGG